MKGKKWSSQYFCQLWCQNGLFLKQQHKTLSGPGEEQYKLWCVKPVKSASIIISFPCTGCLNTLYPTVSAAWWICKMGNDAAGIVDIHYQKPGCPSLRNDLGGSLNITSEHYLWTLAWRYRTWRSMGGGCQALQCPFLGILMPRGSQRDHQARQPCMRCFTLPPQNV